MLRYVAIDCRDSIQPSFDALLGVVDRVLGVTQFRPVNGPEGFPEVSGPLPRVKRSGDPADDFLLALSEAGDANYLVPGDKNGLRPLANPVVKQNRQRSLKIIV